ncbi:MAG: phosphatase PAP2 family protein [Parcubacteria group bacterium]|jgi:membrane-associated phospholipid phosphatase
MRNFFNQLFRNILKIFSGYNLLWHFLAIALTYIIVVSGFDWKFFLYAITVAWRADFFPALALGTTLPVLLPLILILVGLLLKNRKALKVGVAVAQAALLGVLISSFYKAFTGRIQPPGHSHAAIIDGSKLVDISHQFQFGFLRHGVFWGWPSSHTTIAFAMMVTIWVMFPKNKLIRTIALAYAFYVGIAVAMTSIHWFSEFVAGAIIGSVIGMVVGRSFLKESERN